MRFRMTSGTPRESSAATVDLLEDVLLVFYVNQSYFNEIIIIKIISLHFQLE